MAADALGLPQVAAVLGQLVAYIPSIIAAILILAALLANFVSGIVRGATGSDLLASVAQDALIGYPGLAAGTELGGAGARAHFGAGGVRGAAGSDLLASVAQYAIIVYAVFAAVTELGIAVTLTAPTFLILLGAAALAAAPALGT